MTFNDLKYQCVRNIKEKPKIYPRIGILWPSMTFEFKFMTNLILMSVSKGCVCIFVKKTKENRSRDVHTCLITTDNPKRYF